MKILIFSRSRKLPEKLKLRRRKDVVEQIAYVDPGEFTARIKTVRTPTLCYLDVSSLEQDKIPSYLRRLKKNDCIVYGVIDPGSKIRDVARLFHDGAVDYLDRRTLDGGIGMGRLNPILAFIQGINPAVLEKAAESTQEQRRAPYKPSGYDWASVVPGKEYTFAMMFVELDGKDRMEKSYGAKNLSIALASFRRYLEGFVRQFGGKVWMWSSFGGIVLFPFDAKSCPALNCAFRLMLFRHLYDIEGSHFPNFLSFRLVLHIGNTPYTENDTGHIVSDSLNSIFHLGQQFVQPGDFCITEEVLQFGHPALRDYFLPAGAFEGRNVLRMRLPIHRHKRK